MIDMKNTDKISESSSMVFEVSWKSDKFTMPDIEYIVQTSETDTVKSSDFKTIGRRLNAANKNFEIKFNNKISGNKCS
jgi:hypothetical protein